MRILLDYMKGLVKQNKKLSSGKTAGGKTSLMIRLSLHI